MQTPNSKSGRIRTKKKEKKKKKENEESWWLPLVPKCIQPWHGDVPICEQREVEN
jgi:hypothetical protein